VHGLDLQILGLSAHGVVISGWFVRFSDYQRNLRFRSKVAEMAIALQKEADFLSDLS